MNIGRRPARPARPWLRPVPDIAPVRRVWVCAGLVRLYRVTDGSHDYGEWDEAGAALAFLELLLAGNPTTMRRL